MTANQLVVYLNWAVFLLLFGRVLAQAIRRPWRINVDIALLFSAPAVSALMGIASALGWLPASPELRNIRTALLLLIAFLLFRLVDDFVIVDARLRRAFGAATLLLAFVVALTPVPQPRWLPGLAFLTVIGLLLYGVVAFLRGARLVSGVTRRRMQVVAIGSLLLVATFVVATPALLAPGLRDLAVLLADSCALAAGICYFIGFAPPRVLRRSWQEPELRAFLGHAARLPRLPDTAAIVAEMERGAASALGAPSAALALWSAATQTLQISTADQPIALDPAADELIAAVWRSQQPCFAEHNVAADPTIDALRNGRPVVAALLAPVTAGETRVGVLAVVAARVPIFAADDLALVQLLADQAAVILESRALIDEAARVRAHAEITRLREDFLAAAAHDLRTPLTALIGRAELLARRSARDPERPVDRASVEVIVHEAHRLKRLVGDLLDATRAEQGQLLGPRSTVDLLALAESVCARHRSDRHRCRVTVEEPVVGSYDALRIEQLLENLVENAVKYSPAGGTVEVTLRQRAGQVELLVADQGIGIPEADLPHIFDRFHRATNVDQRRMVGSGLGLFICRGIVEQHGGQLGVTSRPGHGTTFRVTLPHQPVAVDQQVYV